MFADVFHDRHGTVLFHILLRRIKAHAHGHQFLSDQVGLRRFFHADGDVGFPHRQIENTLFEHQIDLKVRIFFVQLWQSRSEPERAEPSCGCDAQFAKYFFFTVFDPRGCRLEALVHRFGGVKQQLALFGQDETTGVSVK